MANEFHVVSCYLDRLVPPTATGAHGHGVGDIDVAGAAGAGLRAAATDVRNEGDTNPRDSSAVVLLIGDGVNRGCSWYWC